MNFTQNNVTRECLAFVCAWFVSVALVCSLFPLLYGAMYGAHFPEHVRIGGEWRPTVNRSWPEIAENCSCECWDGKFKSYFGRGWYKSVFWNMTTDTAFLYAWTIFHALLAYHFVRGVFESIFFRRRHVDWLFGFALMLTVYPVFYGFWTAWNYVNDAYYELLFAQLVFSLTEIIEACALYAQFSGQLRGDSRLAANVVCVAASVAAVHLEEALLNLAGNLSLEYARSQVHRAWFKSGRDFVMLLGDLVVLYICLARLVLLVPTDAGRYLKRVAFGSLSVYGLVMLILYSERRF